MANLNETNLDEYLDSDTFDLGGSINPDATVDFKLKWKKKKEDIEFTYGSCHCTDSFYENGYIRGTLNVSKSNYDRNTGAVSQYAYIYLNDGQPFFETDSKKRRTQNSKKNWLRIHLSGTVDLGG